MNMLNKKNQGNSLYIHSAKKQSNHEVRKELSRFLLSSIVAFFGLILFLKGIVSFWFLVFVFLVIYIHLKFFESLMKKVEKGSYGLQAKEAKSIIYSSREKSFKQLAEEALNQETYYND